MTAALPGCVVADAGPLIALARIGRLGILHDLFGRVLVPPAVFAELCIGSSRPGAAALAAASSQGWLVETATARVPLRLQRLLDRGEAEAIVLAQRTGALLVIDEATGRRAARHEHVHIIGTGAVLIAAKRRGLIADMAPLLEALLTAGYRLSAGLQHGILAQAGEE